MRHRNTNIKRSLSAALLALVLAGCASTRDVPLSIHSDPLGAYVLIQVQNEDGTSSDWILLGNSPVQMTREVNLRNATTVSLKVIKEGYFEQIKAWNVDDFIKEHRKQGRILWVPHLVESNSSE